MNDPNRPVPSGPGNAIDTDGSGPAGAGARPSARRIAGATVAALAVASALLVTAVLPAEYGLDPLGTGKLLGLVQLAEVRPGAIALQPAEFRVDAREFVLGPFQSVEYKYRIEQGGSMLFSWQATGLVASELHSEPDGAPQGFAETFDKQQGTSSHGAYNAPFGGMHGWYWENVDKTEVRVSLETAGFYSWAREFFDGGQIDHEVRDLTGNPVRRPSK